MVPVSPAPTVALAAAGGQNWLQVDELLLAFVLSSAIGLERQLRGKSAGLRTQAIVGTASALLLLVSKYGFSDVLVPGSVVLDPSRVAAQIVTGVGFLGAGLIITRQGSIRGLTTAAAVWETAAIGMAAGAGLAILALLVTALHFVVVVGYTPLTRRLTSGYRGRASYAITYVDGRGILRDVLAACTGHSWSVSALGSSGVSVTDDVAAGDDAAAAQRRLVSLTLDLTGPGADDAITTLGRVEGVVRVERADDE